MLCLPTEEHYVYYLDVTFALGDIFNGKDKGTKSGAVEGGRTQENLTRKRKPG